VAAARGGLVGKKYPWGNTPDITYTNIPQSNRFIEKAGQLHRTILPVGTLLPNGYGIHDIYGNVAEMTTELKGQSSSFDTYRHYYAFTSYKAGGTSQLGNSIFTYRSHSDLTGSSTSAVGFRLVRRP
jgi:formylglycine-generating enzyme required for sulfatase activity